MTWKAVIDRIEEDLAVVLIGDEEEQIHIPTNLLPEGAQEGDHLIAHWELDPQSTEAARERVTSLLERLKSKPKK